MTIKISRTQDQRAAAALIVRAGVSPKNHPFLASLDREDKVHFLRIFGLFDAKGNAARSDILPSGKRLILIPVGEAAKFSHRKAILAARRVIAAARAEKIKQLEIFLDDFAGKGGPRGDQLAEMVATQSELANFEFNRYKEVPPEGWSFVENLVIVAKRTTPRSAEAIERGRIVGEEINKARTLSNTPGADMTPETLAEAARSVGKETGVSVKVLDEVELERLKMGAILGVARGSAARPRFIIMEYWAGKTKEAPTVLVGKGVTFDTGGLNLKPSDHIYEMHMDMSGGAAVIHTIAALARLKVKKNVIGLIPAVENMPSGSSYRPGDVLTAMSGKTIEILNTDAEGRVILADALTYAKKYGPKLVIDVATLTGAAEIALGHRASAFFTNEPRHTKPLTLAGELTGDYVWPLPLWEEYEEEIKGTFGDVANIGKYGRAGGAITGAVFLWQFIKQTPWIHVDIAPRMTTLEGDSLAKGSAAPGVGLLIQFLRSR